MEAELALTMIGGLASAQLVSGGWVLMHGSSGERLGCKTAGSARSDVFGLPSGYDRSRKGRRPRVVVVELL